MRSKKILDRRSFLDLLGKGAVSTALLPYFTTSCTNPTQKSTFLVKEILPSSEDKLLLTEGLEYDVLIKWGDKINGNDSFGYNNDFLCFTPLDESGDDGILWSNHEYVNSLFIHGTDPANSSKDDIEKEMYNVGGSLIRVKKIDGKWKFISDDSYNRRINGLTSIPFNWDEPIKGANSAMGTLGNCAGGYTPWGTVLTCEENFQLFYNNNNSDGELIFKSLQNWEREYPDNHPEHYGWVVEVDPKTGEAQKHIALGRCYHECATIKELEDGRLVVYTGDDKNDECLYKFISSKPASLKEGTLYVANTEKGEWIPVDIEKQPDLKVKFKTQTDALVYLRESSRILGGSPLDRPEDIEIDPVNGNVLVALSNNIPKGNYFGAIMKVEEEGGKHDSLKFKATTYLAGGEETGFASPDNMVFDRKGNLWFTSDISGSKMNKPPYEPFKNNGLFLVLREGSQAGEVIQVASAPIDAEFTGPWFSPDNETLFLSVQHPGELSASMDQLTSHWPEGNSSIPKSSVVTITGSLLKQVQGLV